MKIEFFFGWEFDAKSGNGVDNFDIDDLNGDTSLWKQAAWQKEKRTSQEGKANRCIWVADN